MRPPHPALRLCPAGAVTLFLLLVLVPGGAPAHAAFPLDPEPAAGPPVAESSTGPAARVVVVDGEEWAQAVRQAAALRRLLAERDIPAVLALAVLAGEAGPEAPDLDAPGDPTADPPDGDPDTDLELAPGGPADGMASVPDWLQALSNPGLQRCRGREDPVEGTLCTVEVLLPLLPPELRPDLVDEAGRLMNAWVRPGELPVPGVAGAGSGFAGGEALRFGPLHDLVATALGSAVAGRLDAGGGAAGSASTVSTALQVLAGLDPGAEVGVILAEVPEIRQLVRGHPSMASLERAVRGGPGDLFLEAESVLSDYRSFLSSAPGEARRFLAEDVEAGVRDLTRLGRDPVRSLLDRVAAEADRPVDWASERAFAQLVSGTAALAGLDGSTVERIRSLGASSVDLRQELRAFAVNRRDLGPGLAVSLLSGNALGVASGVAGFLGLTSPGLDPEAARDLREIRSMVETLSTRVDTGFQEMDTRFDEVMGELDRGFGRMETLVRSGQREVQTELARVRDELDRVAGRIDRLDANLVTYLEAGFDREHARTLVRCLEHRERHVPPFDEMPFSVFSSCLADFRTRGTMDARDALLTDRTTPVEDAAILQALADTSSQNLARRLPLLARTAEQRLGYGGLRGGRGGANPVEWAVAAQAYLALLRDWPDHARGVSTGDLDALVSTGVEVNDLLVALRRDPVTGSTGLEGAADGEAEDDSGVRFPTGQAGGAMGRALAAYRSAADELIREVELLAGRHEQARLRRVDPATLLDRMEPEDGAALP
ncbi:MAG: hypothetical protein EA352_11865, partial [Gemmatimonadales bacterium]